MKTFKDLEFKIRKELSLSDDRPFRQAKMTFCNGYGVSVITGTGTYTNNEYEYELAVLKHGSLCYTTDITDDVIGHLSEDEVTEIMEKIQVLED